MEVQRAIAAQKQHGACRQRHIVPLTVAGVIAVGGQILVDFNTVLIADDVQVNGCIALGTLDSVGALGQILPYGVQARRQVAVPVRTSGGYSAAQVVVGIAVGLCGLFFGEFGNGLGNRGTDFTLQQDLQHGQNQKQRHNDDKPRNIGTASASGGCLDVVLHPGRAHRGTRCIVTVCAALVYMGGALFLVVAVHLGAAAGGPHAVQHILAVDAVVVGAFAPQGVGMFGRDGHAAFLTSAIDDPPAAQAAFLHGIASSFHHYTGSDRKITGGGENK